MNGQFTNNLPFAQYRAIPALNASAIKAGRTSMLHMRHAIQSETEATSAMARGTLIHSMVLDPNFWGQIVINDENRNSSLFKAFAKTFESKTILKTEQAEELRAIESAVKANKDAVDLLTRCAYEVTAEWLRSDCGACKARFDALANDHTFFIDLKTCSDISPRAVGSQFVSLGYDIQYGWYRDGLENITGKRAKVYQVNIETSTPYDVTVDEVYPEACDNGLQQAIEIATRYRECERSGVFPGVRGYIAKMELPQWYMERLDLSGDLPMGLLDE